MALHKAGCHCGAVAFEFHAPAAMSVTICDCSMCSMSGYKHVFVPQEDVRFLSGQDNLSVYTFNTHAAKHMFCKTCGIKPLYIPRSHPDSYSLNLNCIASGTLQISETIAFGGGNWEENIASLKRRTDPDRTLT